MRRWLQPALLFVLAAQPGWSQSAVWQPQGATAGNIYYNGGNVGIGIDAPLTRLDVKGSITSSATAGGASADVLFGDFAGNSRAVVSLGDGTSAVPGLAFYVAPAGTNAVWPASLRMHITPNGNVGIGTVNPDYKLAVNGVIGAREIIVTNAPWSDYVFRPDYRLPPLSEVASFIRQHGHLPDIPTEAEVNKNGIGVAEMQAKLLAKVEELTLHAIRQERELDRLRSLLADASSSKHFAAHASVGTSLRVGTSRGRSHDNSLTDQNRERCK